MFLKNKTLSFFVFLFITTKTFAEQHVEINPVTEVQQISEIFNWQDISDDVAKLDKEKEADQLIASFLLIYHYLRREDYQSARINIQKVVNFETWDDAFPHKLFRTGLRILDTASLAYQKNNDKELIEKKLIEIDAEKPQNSIEKWILCYLQNDDFGTGFKWKFSSQHTTLLNCSRQNTKDDLYNTAAQIMSGGATKEASNQIIESMENFYRTADNLYDKLDILAGLLGVSQAFENYETLLSASVRLNQIMEKNGLNSTKEAALSLLSQQSLKNAFGTEIDEHNFSYHRYLDKIKNKEAFFEALGYSQLNNFLAGLSSEQGAASELFWIGFRVLEKDWQKAFENYKKSESSRSSIANWALSIEMLARIKAFAENDIEESIQILEQFILLYENEYLSNDEKGFLANFFELLESKENNPEVWEQIFGAQSQQLTGQFGPVASQIYALLGDLLIYKNQDKLAAEALYKSLLFIPPEWRLNRFKSLDILQNLVYFHAADDWFYDSLILAINETAENIILNDKSGNFIKRFENFPIERHVLKNNISRLHARREILNQERGIKPNDLVYNTIQLLRMNRVTMLFSSNDGTNSQQLLNLSNQVEQAKSVFNKRNVEDVRSNIENVNRKLLALSDFQLYIPRDTAIIVGYDSWFTTNFTYIDTLTFAPNFAEIEINELVAVKNKILNSTNFNEHKNSLPDFDYKASNWLYNAIFNSEIINRLLSDKKNILFLPSQSLFNLPISLLHNGDLVNYETNNKNSFDPNGFLIDQFHIAHLVDIDNNIKNNLFNEFLATEAKLFKPRAKSFLGLADPKFESQKSALLRGLNFIENNNNLEPTVNFSALPETLEEVQSASKYFKDQSRKILSGADANKKNLLSENLGSYDIIMFSTHGLAPGMITGFEDSALVLAPNQKDENNSLSNNMLLMSNDILKLNLNAELVILNACSTGLSNARNAPGLTGLAQSFLAAGAESIMVSHWKIDSNATKAVTEKMFGILNSEPKFSYNYALSKAQKILKTDKATQHPFYWAAFTIFNNF